MSGETTRTALKKMKTVHVSVLLLLTGLTILAGCAGKGTPVSATPTIDPAIYNQVPKTTVFEPGQCSVVLDKPTPGFTSNTLGGQSSGEIPAGTYQVGVAADYGSSLWYQLNGVGEINYINSTSAASTKGNCSTAK
jgi:hypothetical protein